MNVNDVVEAEDGAASGQHHPRLVQVCCRVRGAIFHFFRFVGGLFGVCFFVLGPGMTEAASASSTQLSRIDFCCASLSGIAV